MLATSSTTLVSMASQLSEAEERERVFSGKGRWNQVRSLAEAKNLMNYLFNLASSSRCILREKEFICRDKHMDINDHKKIIDNLRFALEQLKKQRDGLDHQLKLMVSMFDLEMSEINFYPFQI
ncbi:chromosome-associated kinesin KIF4-like [Trifolium medium]|uniref:Chromosome-associated kinesin KIF4-like n=1 Tax=Trifolium medium TaxID=97028 RepID=A0A392PVX4_9FABA|nr:chromosome-associated kinesin KIF4-like [Trifolium medium]